MPFSFFNAALMWGSGLVSVPIIIHLLNRQRYRVIDWAAMEWLLLALKQNRRRVLIEQLLLLALRCLIILLIVLAVSKIYFSGEAGIVGELAGTRTDWVVVLDDSFPMGQTVGTGSCFDRAKDEIAALLDPIVESKGNHSFTLVTARERDEALPHGARVDVDFARRVQKVLADLEPSDLCHPPGALLESGLHLFEGSEADHRKLIVLSDCRVKNWRLDDTALKARLQTVDENIEVHVIDVGPPSVDQTANLSVDIDLSSAPPAFEPGVPAELVAVVRNHGQEPARDVALDCAILSPNSTRPNVRPTHVFSEIPARGSAEHAFTPQLDRQGVYAVTLKIATHGKDTLAADNTHYFALEVAKGFRVLIVDGEPGESKARSEAHYARLGLEAGTAKMGIQPVARPARTVRPEEIDNADVVILANVDKLGDDRLAALRRLLKRGGGLAIFLGDQVAPARFNALFAGRERGDADKPAPPIAPGRLAPPVGTLDGRGTPDARFVRFDLRELAHPLLAKFEECKVLFQDVRFYKYFPVILPEDPEAENVTVIARYDDVDRSPAIIERKLFETRTVRRGDAEVEKSVETGRVVLINTTADTEWTNWPRRMAYPMFMPVLAEYLYTPPAGRRTVRVGSPYKRRLDTLRFQKDPIVVRFPPEEGAGSAAPRRTLKAVTEKETGVSYLALDEELTRAAGIYRIRLRPAEGAAEEPGAEAGDQEETTQFFAANLDPEKSDLRRHEPEDLERSLATAGVRYGTAAGDVLRIADETRAALWHYVLILLGCTMALESFLGWKFGHHTR
ncbi:MAG: BatA domain-containing protein [Planctomycetota bacterium]